MSYSDANGNGSIETIGNDSEIIEENNYYPFGLQHKGYNNNINGVENNYHTFQGQEEEKELGKNTYAYEWRDYDPAIARFNKIDRFAEKYERLSPYNFSANNPIYFREIAGDSLDLSHIFKKNDDGTYVNSKQAEALQFFAGTKEGKSWLSKFASKGQSIEGTDISFGSDGEYHSEGIDLGYNTKEMTTNNDGRDAETSYTEEDNGRLTISVSLGIGSSGYSGVGDITHESFIHADKFATDFIDNGQMDYSNLNNEVSRYRKVMRQHVYTKIFERRDYKGIFANQGFSIMQQANKKYNENKTRTQVWNTMYEYVD